MTGAVGLTVVVSGVVAWAPPVGASGGSAGASGLEEPEPLDLDRDQEARAAAIEGVEQAAKTELRPVELPAGALDGTAGPDLLEGEDESTLRDNDGDGTVAPEPPVAGTVAEPEALPPPAEVGEVGDVADVVASPEPAGEDLLATAEATSQDDGGGDDLGDLVAEAAEVDLDGVEPGDEVTELRTEDSRTFLREDGTFRTELGSEPMFAETADGDFVEPEPAARGSRDERWRPEAGRAGVSFGANARDRAVGSIGFGPGRQLSWSVKGASRAPGRPRGDAVVYDDVFEDVDLHMEASLTGVKETIVIRDPSAPRSYDFPLDLSGLEAELADPYGSVVLRDAETREPVGVIPSAWAQDASRGPRGETPDPGPVAYRLIGSGADTVLRVTVDQAWFEDPSRVFPVQVDPTVGNYSITGDTWIHNNYPTTNRSTSTLLKTGGGGGNKRTYFARWDVGWLVSASIISANYQTLNSYSYSCSARPFQVYRVTSNWNPATVTWGSQPSFSPTVVGAWNESHGYTGCAPAAMNAPVTALVQKWVDGALPNYGLTGRVSGNDGYNDNFTYKEFASTEAGGQKMQIVWSPYRVKYAVGGPLTEPSPTVAGSIKVNVTNKAPTTWGHTGANRFRLTYHVFKSDGTTLCTTTNGCGFNGYNLRRTDLPASVAWGKTATVNVTLNAMPIGDYIVKFDMVQEGTNKYFSVEGDHPDLYPMSVRVSVGNTPPYISSANPAGVVESRTPTLKVTGVNPDNFPTGALEYTFKLCADEAMTTGCQNSPWQTSNQWAPTGLRWAQTYYWRAAVRETGSGALTTAPDWQVPLAPTIVQPRTEKHFGADPYAPAYGGVNPSIGNFVTTATDVQVAAAGLPVELTRTYNSMDGRVGAFGPGWSTSLDLRAEPETGGKLLVRFSDGRQERYAQDPDGSWAGPPGSASVLRSRDDDDPDTVADDGWELERTDKMTYVFQADGKPIELRDAWGHRLTFSYDGSGRIETVTNVTSQRTMTLTWGAQGPSGADVITGARTDAATTGGPEPQWTYGYDGGRLVEVCAPGEPLTGAACTEYAYHSSTTSTSPEAVGKLRTVTRQEGNVTTELDYRRDGAVAWVENGEDDRWTFSDTDDAAEGTYHPLDGAVLSGAPASIGTNASATVDVTGVGGIPSTGVQAVVVDIAAAGSSQGWLSARPSGTPEVTSVSTMTYLNEARSTLHTVAVGADGNIVVANHGASIFINFEVVGWYGTAGTTGGSVYVPVRTTRTYDSRVSGAGGAIGAGGTRDVQVLGQGGVPSEGVTGVVYDLEAIGTTATTGLTAYAKGVTRPSITTLQAAPSRTTDNLHVTKVGTDGKITVWNQAGSVNIAVNVVGYFADPALHDGSVFRPVTYKRLVNTLSGSNYQYEGSPWSAGATRSVDVAGEGPFPGQGITAMVGEIQAYNPGATTPMRATATGTTGDGTTILGQTATQAGNSVYVGVGGSGTFDLWSQLATDVVVDAVGYFTPVPRTTIVTDPRNNTVEYRYDSLGRLVGEVDEAGFATARAYDDAGFLSSKRDEAGVGTRYTYDDEGHMLSERLVQYYGLSDDPEWESTTWYGYVDDAANPRRDGKLAWVADGRSQDADDTTFRTTYTYDTLGQTLTVRGPALPDATGGVGVTRTYTDGTTKPSVCDAVAPAGFLQTETDAKGLVTTFCYDAKGDQRAVHRPTGLVDRTTYDLLGRAVSETQVSSAYPSGLTTTREYDIQGRVTRIVDPRSTSAVTDPVDGRYHQMESVTEHTPNGNVAKATMTDLETDESRWVSYSYDDADRPIGTEDNAGRTTSRTYDDYGNLRTEVGQDGAQITNTYDARNLLTKVTADDVVDDPIGAPGTQRDVDLMTFYYDQRGRRWAEVDARGRVVNHHYRADDKVELSSVRLYEGASISTGLPTGAERTGMLAAAQYDQAGNATFEFAPSNVRTIDEFSGTSISTAWTSTGSWSLAGGVLTAGGAGQLTRPGAADGQITTTSTSAAPLAATFRVKDASNYFEVVFNGTLVTANAVIDGVANQFEANLMSAALGAGDRVEIKFTGDRLRVYRNRTLVMQTWIKAETFGTGVGLKATASAQAADRFRFDAYTRTENTFDVYGRQIASTVDPGGAALRTESALLPDGRPKAVYTTNGITRSVVQQTRIGYVANGNPGAGELAWSEEVMEDPDGVVNDPEGDGGGTGDPDLGTETISRTEITYDQRNLQTRVVTAAGSAEASQTDNVYDELGQLVKTTGPARTVERYGEAAVPNSRPFELYGYDGFGEQTHLEDAAGRLSTVEYDGRGLPVETHLPSYTPPGGSAITRSTSSTYDDMGRVLTSTDAKGEVTTYTYNTFGYLVAREDPAVGSAAAGVTRFDYDDQGSLVETVDPTGAVVRNNFDEHGRLVSTDEIVRQPSLETNTSVTTYGDAGGTVLTISPEGVRTTSEHDLAGRLVVTRDINGNATSYAYDDLGNLARVTSPDGRQTRKAYNLTGDVTKEQVYGPDGTTLLGESRFTWDKQHRMTASASPRGVTNGYATTFTYDAAGQMTQRRTPVSTNPADDLVESWGYDELGQETRFTDGRNNATWQTYNVMGLPEDTVEPAAGPHTAVADRRWRSVYDAAGRVTTQTAPGGVSLTTTYDELDRIVAQAGSGAQATTATRSYTYDKAGRTLTAGTPTASQTFTYDDRGLLLTSNGTSGNSSYAYDGDGRVTTRNDASGTSSIDYGIRGLPVTMTSGLSGDVDFSYDTSGRPTTLDYGSGTTRTFTYDDWGRVETDRLGTGTTDLYEAVYDYDDDGNVTGKTISGTSVPSAGANAYTYDRASRITTWTDPSSKVETFAWDKASNRTQAGVASALTTATYDEQNRLVSTTGPGGLVTNTWSANGTRDQQNVQRRVSMVVGDPAALTTADNVLLFVLAFYGAAVTFVDDAAAVPAASATDVVVVSPSVNTTTLGNKYKDVTIPVVNIAAGSWQANGLTSAAATNSSSGSAFVANAAHPVAAGKTGTVTWLTSSDTFTGAGASSLGGGAATVWRTSSSSTDAAAAVYDTGSAIVGGTAAARRVVLGLSASAVVKLGTDGAAVLAAAVAWADDTTTTFGTTNFDFDAFEQLSKITTPDTTVTNSSYDALGRRLTSPTGALSYAGKDIRPAADGAHRYQRGPLGAIAMDDMSAGGGEWAQADGHTDVVAGFVPGATTLEGAQTFSPWGVPLGTAGDPLPLGFQSERQDLPNGLVGMGVREYDPLTGTFISNDPGADEGVTNGYGYTPANPLGYTDPTGMWGIPNPIKAARNAVNRVTRTVRSVGSHVRRAASRAWSTARNVASRAWSFTRNMASRAWSFARNVASRAWNFARNVASTAWNTVRHVAGHVYNAARSTVRAVANGARAVYNGARAAVRTVTHVVTASARAVAAAAEWVIEDSPMAAAVAATGSAISNYAGRFQQVAGQMIDTGLAAMSRMPVAAQIINTARVLAHPEVIINQVGDMASSVAGFADDVWDASGGQVVHGISSCAGDPAGCAQNVAEAGLATVAGIATTAACTAVTGGAGLAGGACLVAGFAASGAAYSALNCPAGQSIASCALHGGISGGATGIGFALGCPFCGGAAGSIATQAMAGNGINAADVLGAGLLAEGGARLTSRNQAGTSVNNVRTAISNLRNTATSEAAGAASTSRAGPACSFTGNTRVLMADGSTKVLAAVRVGDRVQAADPETGVHGARTVTAVWSHHDTVRDLSVGGDEVTTTEDHRFWNVTDQAWQHAEDLDDGDLLVTADGEVVDVDGLDDGSARVAVAYNLTVEGVHTYYVLAGTTPVLVHNDCGGGTTSYQTYTKTNPETGQVYSGRTSGTGDPLQNLARRDAGHHMNNEGYGPATLDRSSPSSTAIRGREQQLIDAHGGAQSTGGTSGNKINGISPGNARRQEYLDAANQEFG